MSKKKAPPAYGEALYTEARASVSRAERMSHCQARRAARESTRALVRNYHHHHHRQQRQRVRLRPRDSDQRTGPIIVADQ